MGSSNRGDMASHGCLSGVYERGAQAIGSDGNSGMVCCLRVSERYGSAKDNEAWKDGQQIAEQAHMSATWETRDLRGARLAKGPARSWNSRWETFQACQSLTKC